MNDDELLRLQRAKHGDPYMPLSKARKMQRYESRWRHVKKAAKGKPSEPCRYGDGTCLTHSNGRLR